MGIFCVISVALVILLIYIIGGSIVKPVQEIAERMKDIASGEGDLTRSLPEKGQDEITRLARYFNQYTDKMRQSLIGIRDNIAALTDIESVSSVVTALAEQSQSIGAVL